MAHADQQRIYDVLKDFRGLASLKQLFWQELNYDRADDVLSRRTWPDRQANLLTDDPVLFATAGSDGDFHLIYCRLVAEQLSLAAERELVNRLYRDHPYALYIFSDCWGRHWHLVNVKQTMKQGGQMLFRRIALGPGEQVRTASERIAMLDPELLQVAEPQKFGVSAMAIQERHDEAFDVEAVTKRFFEEYRKVFETVEGAVRGIADPERKRLFVQRLFNRLMFLVFVQKKGWLRYPGAGEQTSYLDALWNAYAKTSGARTNFYRDRLKPLFFRGLNTQRKDAELQVIIGEVPYLNGGLFEEDTDDRDTAIVVPDAAIRDILRHLFGRFNFTVTESTPLDVEVAVDPEMLGKIFEELVTGRHETESYYTPKPVVSFMCREALKGYLATATPHEKPEEITRFVDEQVPDELIDPERVLDALRNITVLALSRVFCGSGWRTCDMERVA